MTSSPERTPAEHGSPNAQEPDPFARLPEDMLGVRAVAFILQNLLTFAAAAIIGATAGAGYGLSLERSYVAGALIEIGARLPQEALENPVVVGERIKGLGAKYARKYAPDATIEVANRRDPDTKVLNRYIEVSVRARTASAAETILTKAIQDLLAEHAEKHNAEHRIGELEIAYYQRETTRLESALAAGGEDTSETSYRRSRDGDPSQPKKATLSSALFSVRSLINSSSSVLSVLRTPPTRVITQAPPVLTPSRVPALIIGGFLLAVLAALCAIAVRRLVESETKYSAEHRAPAHGTASLAPR